MALGLITFGIHSFLSLCGGQEEILVRKLLECVENVGPSLIAARVEAYAPIAPTDRFSDGGSGGRAETGGAARPISGGPDQQEDRWSNRGPCGTIPAMAMRGLAQSQQQDKVHFPVGSLPQHNPR